ncbi:hypothetical protein H4N55_14940 [Aeromonas veronii]|uniref:competence protein CoiA family protein n=1 Tax=Aeromonas veronii TaxID=654 RepID=UPI00188DB462|nr:hypothetical protein [Aeromonas veronii]MBF3237895.1 hypothetical protein [Aeromonas veronii]
MDFAFNKVTGRVESAAKASKWSKYACPVCKEDVDFRSGKIRKPYFAHCQGSGSPACENFVPSHGGLHLQELETTPAEMKRMELRLMIPKGEDRSGWSLELTLPSCRECRAMVTLDVGGRSQTLNMLGMAKRRYVTAEPSVNPYRIVSYSGSPDPSFVHGVERECSGLPAFGAAVFTALGSGQLNGFPRAQELRYSETFALLWNMPANPDFPDELFIERIKGRKGWSLALVTLPDSISQECTNWLSMFTKLSIAPPIPSIIPVWPFLTKNTRINEVESIKSGIALLSAKMMPAELMGQGPTMLAQGALAKRSAVGIEQSPAFFALKPEGVNFVEIANANNIEVNKFISFSLQHECHAPLPVIEFVFVEPSGARCIVPLHHRNCAERISEVRRQEARLEYISIPSGVRGTCRVDDSKKLITFNVSSGGDISPHSRHMRLPSEDILVTLLSALADPACCVELEFGGFGRLVIPTSRENITSCADKKTLPLNLRIRLLSFMFQLRISTPTSVYEDNALLIKAFAALEPQPQLIPHYRVLMREILANGIDI